MARTKFSSPRISVEIDDEAYKTAVASDSGGCLIADAIRRVYPRPLRKDDVDVNVATIDIRDREEGVRYTYLTPAVAQQSLLFFDQGWNRPPLDKFVLKGAVKITHIRKAGEKQLMTRAEERGARLLDLENRESIGEPLTASEKRSLTLLRNPRPALERPTSTGPAEVQVINGRAVVEGGSPLTRRHPSGQRNMNLMGGRLRIYGAKIADPGLAFREAVEKAVGASETDRV